MTICVNFPAIMRPLIDNQKSVSVGGATVEEVINNIESQHPGVKNRLISDGKIPGYINLFLNDEDVRFLDLLKTPVRSGDVLTVLPAVAGG